MSNNNDVISLKTIVAELDRRLRALETAPSLQHSSMQNGSIDILDSNGNLLTRLDGTGLHTYNTSGVEQSRLDSNGVSIFDTSSGLTRALLGQFSAGRYGVNINDSGGFAQFRADQDGMRTPYLATPFYNGNASVQITSAAMVEVYRCQFEIISHQGLYVWVAATADAATAGAVRVRCVQSATSTNSVTVPTGGSVTQQFKWLHGQTLGTGPFNFTIDAQRTAGAGNINVFIASAANMTSPTLCTATGL